MHHSPDQLDALWVALKDETMPGRDELLKRYDNPSLPGAAPRIHCDDALAQVLSIPTPDHPGRHVYARRPGQCWAELR